MEDKILTIRKAQIDDLQEITDIYNEAVLETISTFHLYPRSWEEQVRWFESHKDRYPLLVVEDEDLVIGWACLSPYSDREGYQYTVTDSIYIRKEFRRQRIGYELLSILVGEARKLGYHSIVAFIARENLASIRLHEKVGFICRGELKEAGFKFGRWIDVCFYQKMLGGREDKEQGDFGEKVPQKGSENPPG
ncbi:MAG TPA: N-acetyltransferase family protein [Candidatus Atribacteria bacterium]|mgnify:FL=1|nr:N-acetyltransferase family protein [Candidatus Atribacteria bacterium]